MTTLAIILIISLGILLILLEIFVVPGVTIAGIGGLILLGFGVYMSYNNYGIQVGMYTLLGAFIFVIVTLYYSFKVKTWDRVSLKSEINTKIKRFDKEEIKIGDTGKTVSRLAPIGNVLINNKIYEAESKNKLVDENVEIVVIKVFRNKLIVKQK